MKRTLFVAALLASFVTVAYAEDPKVPETLLEPTVTLGRLIQFLGDPKIAAMIPLYDSDVAPLLKTLQRCAALQIPNAQDVTASHGECPAVTAALAPKPAQ